MKAIRVHGFGEPEVMHLEENPDQRLQPLIQEAIFKFDLSPRDAEFLIRFYTRKKD